MLGKPFEWASVQMPLNVMDASYRSFQKHVLPGLTRRQIGVIGMKSLGGGSDGKGRLVTAGVCSATEARTYSLSQDIASLVVGIDSMKVLEQDLALGRSFEPLDEAAMKKLLARVKVAAGDGRHERFKSTQMFDGPYHQKQHGLTPTDVAAP
jgi:hypothetical protein